MEDEHLLPESQNRAPNRASKLWTVCPFILGNEFCERLAYYGIATNLPIYLTDVMNMTTGDASIQTSLFSGACYTTPLIGAWLADGYWGRYKTIVVFSLVYAVGMWILAATALIPGLAPQDSQPTAVQLTVLYLGLYVVALGTGGIKPNVSAFGADQFDDSNRLERKEKQSFFNWFYFAINLGALLASTCIVWIQTKNWGIGFAIPAGCMLMAVLIFIAGKNLYRHQKPTGSPLERLFDLSVRAWLLWLKGIFGSRIHARPRPAEGEIFHDALAQAQAEPSDALDAAGAEQGYTAEQVQEVRAVLRMAPVFLLSISYWTIYTQMASVFVLQGQHMNRTILVGGHEFVIPAASMSMFDTISIIVIIPIYDGIINPLMKKFRCDLTLLQRIGWGFAVAAGAMVMAGVVEERRLSALSSQSNIGILAQVPQFVLVGTSEVLSSIGQIEFFYDQAPDVMRSCCSALALLATALGGYLSAGLMSLTTSFTSWLDNLDDPKTSRLDLYFYLLAVFMLINTVVFVWVAASYKYKVVRHRAPLPRVGGQQPHGAPTLPRGPTAAVNIGEVRPGYGYQYAGTPLNATASDDGPYARSVTYMPQTPVMPPNFK